MGRRAALPVLRHRLVLKPAPIRASPPTARCRRHSRGRDPEVTSAELMVPRLPRARPIDSRIGAAFAQIFVLLAVGLMWLGRRCSSRVSSTRCGAGRLVLSWLTDGAPARAGA